MNWKSETPLRKLHYLL